jgi:hypothetical protein
MDKYLSIFYYMVWRVFKCTLFFEIDIPRVRLEKFDEFKNKHFTRLIDIDFGFESVSYDYSTDGNGIVVSWVKINTNGFIEDAEIANLIEVNKTHDVNENNMLESFVIDYFNLLKDDGSREYKCFKDISDTVVMGITSLVVEGGSLCDVSHEFTNMFIKELDTVLLSGEEKADRKVITNMLNDMVDYDKKRNRLFVQK